MSRRKPQGRPAHHGSSLPARVRCAIYTRKSTEEGLEQAFNSLDAQREACAAYVLSQQHEGWTLLPDVYDDGGFSGGNMDRPGLKQLLADVEAGRVDVIVVYKVDRLTRSLADFAKIVEVLDAKGASFVSVTQAFNTTNSMGRLTLNVLLSFAQFEREVTGERIRDKIAASKKKGMWMGGPVPLGYDLTDRKLVVNEAEAVTVRLIFERYRTLQSLEALADDLHRCGVHSKIRMTRDGRITGGLPFTPGALRHVLRNRLYIGEVAHHDKAYPGEQQAIVERGTWEAVQQLLSRARPRPRSGQVSALAGRIHDASGRMLKPAHANRSGKRYRYYVSATRDAAGCWRLPAGDVETIVARTIEQFLGDTQRVSAELGGFGDTALIASTTKAIIADGLSSAKLRSLLETLNASVMVEADALHLILSRDRLAELVGISLPTGSLDEPIRLTVPSTLKRRGHELRLVYAASADQPAQRDERLVDLIGRGWAAWQQLSTGERITDPVRRSHLTRLARLRFLAPDIIMAIIEGRQPVELTARTLLRIANLPLAWAEQRRVLGFR